MSRRPRAHARALAAATDAVPVPAAPRACPSCGCRNLLVARRCWP
ncbi:hypothetical protein ACXZ65_34535 [Streptomyces aculeolatus]